MSSQYDYERQAKIPEQQKEQPLDDPDRVVCAVNGEAECICGRKLIVTLAEGKHDIPCPDCGTIFQVANYPRPVDLKRTAKH